MKKLLSILTSVSLAASALTTGVFAAPSLTGTVDTAVEFIPEITITEKEPERAILSAIGPTLVNVIDTAKERNTEFGAPENYGMVSLMSELSGEGTEESPYLIGTADELKTMASNVNDGKGNTAHYKLVADIDLEGEEWTPIGHYNENKYDVSFCGVFDGDGHTVSNFKITKDKTKYLGFFGYVANAQIKNLNIKNASVNFVSSNIERLYVSPLIGRIVTKDSLGGKSSVTNCNVISSSVNVTSNGTVYAGGIAGSIITAPKKDSEIFVALSTAECDIRSISKATQYIKLDNGKTDYHVAYAGGISSYILADLDSKITVLNCSASGDIYSSATEITEPFSLSMCGGAFGDVRNIGESGIGTLYIRSCYSEGNVEAYSGYSPYVTGGFAGQIYLTNGMYINDCYSSCDVTGEYDNAGCVIVDINGKETSNLDPTAGGFAGQIMFDEYNNSYGKPIKNCYANGDIKDISVLKGTGYNTDPSYSFVGGFTAWTTDNLFENCYRFEVQTLSGTDVNYTDFGNIGVLSEQDSKYIDKYIGYDMEKTWEMNPEAEYFYPTLREKTGYVNFISEGKVFATETFGSDGYVSAPASTPEKPSTIDKDFTFNYWSLSKNGASFNFSSDTFDKNSELYAVYSSTAHQYTVTFMNEGNVFGTPSVLDYGAAIKAPSSTPTKKDTDTSYFQFLYWSKTAGGNQHIFDEYSTVVGDVTFYAVYEEIDKSAWTGNVATQFNSGFGTETLPYVIKTADEFALFAKVINEQNDNYKNAHFELGDNINLGKKYWKPIGASKETPFSGHFDGNGFSVGNFKIASGNMIGLFGYIFNGTVKDLHIKNFNVDFSVSSASPDYNVYIGALAGYVHANHGTSDISGITVSAGTINVKANVENVYAGGIIGYGTSNIQGYTLITNSFAENNITIKNDTGYNYVGGVAGRFDTGSSSLSLIELCYTTGSVHSESYHSSKAGGLVGYLYSYGSAYAPDGGSVSSEETENNNDASLMDDDRDVMIKNSFAVTNVYSLSTEYTSSAGRITGEINAHAGLEKAYYPDIDISVIAAKGIGTNQIKIELSGSALPHAYFTIEELLVDELGFDCENVWMFVDGYDYNYPILRCTVSSKPVFKLEDYDLTNGVLDATVHVYANEKDYAVIISVYNDRNQMIAVKKVNLQNTGIAATINAVFDNMEYADRIVASVVGKYSLKPLFESITQKL